ncbi:EAL domain-containing protein [Nakamurella flavida]|uniref:EAL domain-containing protein n=1 Tax=Nakamurella flavida TaxID=363630 RepID=A0A939C2W7_9ACTN|nr:EAL domain-containing protein [Nakamurella flavida]MBM9476461.1 EAL domain-containing protein [Nakamurella flavida]MDP9779438.1 diguanylate cyclase (GGDEF)-like protein [Nakamurella flavida]
MSYESRRSRSAQHYLAQGSSTAKLETLLTLISQTMGFPEVRVNIVDHEKQHTIAAVGTGRPSSVARSQTFCDEVVRSGRAVAVGEAARDPRFADFTAVADGEIGSYVGVPLVGRESMVVGAVCVLDPARREIGPDLVGRLTQFGSVVEDQLDLLRRLREGRLDGAPATDEIARAIRDGEIVPWYQPVVDLTTGAVRGLEALARWEDPARGVVDPLEFVPLAENSDLIMMLDLAVMRRALREFAPWQRQLPDLRLQVNLSGRHLTDRDSAATVHEVVLDAGISPTSVDLELTETAQIDVRGGDAHALVQRMRHNGFQVWLDDFGTGWSSFEHLVSLSVDGIKIDRAVAVALGTPVGNALVSAVTGLASAMKLHTTIEGIETREQADQARALGCDHGQGFLWAAPAPAPSTARLLTATLPVTDPLPRAPARRPLPPPTRSDPQTGSPDDHAGRPPSGTDESLATVPVQLSPPDHGPLWSVGGLASAALDALPDATAVLDHRGRIVAVNHTWRMFALDHGEPDSDSGVGVDYLDVCARSARAGCVDAAEVAVRLRAVLSGRCVEQEYEYPCPTPGVERWFLARISALAGPVRGAVISHVNTTRRRRAEAELEHAASHDPLTGLANRALFHRRLTAALRTRTRTTRHVASSGVLYIDLDGFKPVNDIFGHGAGDEVLAMVAHRLRRAVRPGDTVARLGGDEFAVLATGVDLPGLEALASRVEQSLTEPHIVHGRTVTVPASMGAHLAHAGDNPDRVIDAADRLMYAAKRGRSLTG